MLKRALLIIASAAALAACGAGETPPAATEVRVSDTPCTYSEQYAVAEAQPEVFGETIDDDPLAAVGISVRASAGSTCSGSAKDGQTLTCVVNGPVFGVMIQDIVAYDIPEGRTATYTHSAGASACFLNEAPG